MRILSLQDEPIVVDFFPVIVDMPTLMRAYSKLSIETKLDQIDCNCSQTTYDHNSTTLGDASPSTNVPSCVKDNNIVHSLDNECCDVENESIGCTPHSHNKPRCGAFKLKHPSECGRFPFKKFSRSDCDSGSSDYVQMYFLNTSSGSSTATTVITEQPSASTLSLSSTDDNITLS